MPQAFFYYQQKIDPSWYATEQAAVPDLSWLGIAPPPPARPRSLESQAPSPGSFLAPPDALPWAQTQGVSAAAIARQLESRWSDASTLSLLDTSWLLAGAPTPLRAPGFASQASNSALFVVADTTPDLSWLGQQALAPRLRQTLDSTRAEAGWYLPIAPPPDLSWVSPPVGPVLRLPVIYTTQLTDASIFLAVLPAARHAGITGQFMLLPRVSGDFSLEPV